MGIVALLAIVVIFLVIPKLSEIKNLEAYVLFALIITEIMIFLTNYKIENKRYSEDKNIKHSQQLAEVIFHPLSFSYPIRLDHKHFLWYHEATQRIDPVKGRVYDTHVSPVDHLKDQQAFKWAFQHLESKNYAQAKHAWDQVNSLCEQSDRKWSSFKEELEVMIKSEMNNSFPTFVPTPDISEIPHRYNFEKMRALLLNAFETNQTFFEEFIVDRISKTTMAIMPKGYDKMTAIVFCPSAHEDKLSIEKFNQVLKNIRNNGELVKIHHDYRTTFAKTGEELSIFIREINYILEKINHLKAVEGKCELGY